MQGKKQYAEKLFSNFQLSQRVPEENFYRQLKQTLDLQFLYQHTKTYYGSEGQKSIDPVVFFKLILAGYFENITSDRKIIEHAKLRLDILYFIGYDIDEELPWHSTLSRTRQLYGEEIFKQLFKKVLSLCVEKQMVLGKRQAIDSVHVKANASMDNLLEKEIIQDADTYTEELIKNTEDKNEKHTVTKSKLEKVNEHHKWKEKEYKDMPGHGVKEHTKYTNENHRPRFLSNHTHYSTTDGDARIAVKPGKPRQLNYLGQVSVDTAQHVITNIEAHHADKRDSECLAEVLDNTIKNLEENNLAVEEILADTAYSSGTALKHLKEKNITGYIPNFGQYKNTRPGFIYNKEKDQYACTRGNEAILPFRKTVTTKEGYTKKIYRSTNAKCKDCPLRNTCIGTSDYKKIEDSIHKPYYDEMHTRLQTPKARRLKKQRSSTVEPVIGTLVNFMSMRRVYCRGIKNANKYIIGAAIAYNIKKYMKYISRKANIKTIALQIPDNKAIQSMIKLIFLHLQPS
jgi:transposase